MTVGDVMGLCLWLPIWGIKKHELNNGGTKTKATVRAGSSNVSLGSHPHMTTGKTIALTRWTFVGKVMSLLFNVLSKFVIAFLPRSKGLLISF